MTPEQAVKDYYAAASHHFPHYRRMWLLLSADGQAIEGVRFALDLPGVLEEPHEGTPG